MTSLLVTLLTISYKNKLEVPQVGDGKKMASTFKRGKTV